MIDITLYDARQTLTQAEFDELSIGISLIQSNIAINMELFKRLQQLWALVERRTNEANRHKSS